MRFESRHSTFRTRHSALVRHKATLSNHGFTLVELLVVITIIGVLVGLLIPAVSAAFRSAQQRQIALEIATIAQGIEQYRNDVAGGSYPPDAMIGTLPITGGPAAAQQLRESLVSDFRRHFNKAFPRSREPETLIAALVGVFTGPPSNGTTTEGPASNSAPAPATNNNLAGGISPAEAMVFWLQRFSSDPQFPISGPGGPSFGDNNGDMAVTDADEDLGDRNWLTNLEPTRLGPRNDAGGFDGREIRYFVDLNSDGSVNGPGEERLIHFWQYFPADSPQPLVYFDASRGIHDLNHLALGAEIHPLKQLRSGGNSNPSARLVSDLRLVNEDKYQILHAGLDEEWGDFGSVGNPAWLGDGTMAAQNVNGAPVILFPNGPFTQELGDTIVNFSDQATLEDSQP